MVTWKIETFTLIAHGFSYCRHKLINYISCIGSANDKRRRRRNSDGKNDRKRRKSGGEYKNWWLNDRVSAAVVAGTAWNKHCDRFICFRRIRNIRKQFSFCRCDERWFRSEAEKRFTLYFISLPFDLILFSPRFFSLLSRRRGRQRMRCCHFIFVFHFFPPRNSPRDESATKHFCFIALLIRQYVCALRS